MDYVKFDKYYNTKIQWNPLVILGNNLFKSKKDENYA